MKKKSSTYEQVLTMIQKSEKRWLKPVDIYRELNVSRVIVHRYLKQLLDEGKIHKCYRSPMTVYGVISQEKFKKAPQIRVSGELPSWAFSK